MTPAQALHEMFYRLPRGAAATALLAAIRSDWPREATAEFIARMDRADLELAFTALCEAVAAFGEDVPSPSYGGPDDFEQARACAVARK